MQVYIGIDWSEDKHDVLFMNEAGADLARLVIPQKKEGLEQFEAARQKLGLAPEECVIGIETVHNLIVDYLLDRPYRAVYVLAPNQVHDNQGRFRQSGARDDPFAARLIADILRTDRGRLHPWQPDSLLTRQMRAQWSWLLQLTRQTTRLGNRLRSVLLRYYPAALAVFRNGVHSQITAEFIGAYPSPQAAQALSQADFMAFARQHQYPHPKQLASCYARLQEKYPPAPPEVVAIYQTEALQLAHLLLETMHTHQEVLKSLQKLYHQHPKFPVFASLPGAGEIIGPGLLAHFGDDLKRFPDPASVQTLAGTAPVTEKSGKSKYIHFRWACDKEWRYICQEWANVLVNRTQAPIAVAYYQQIRPRCHSEQHALRCVANRWLAVAWKLWQTNQIYDEAVHFKQREARSKPR
jgi:transposase